MSYYILDCITDHPVSTASHDDKFMFYDMGRGRPLNKPKDIPIISYLDLGYEPDKNPGIIKPWYKDTIPLFRQDLLTAIIESGVDNLEIYDAILKDVHNGIDYMDYKAVNVIGLIDCIDKGETKIAGLDTLGGLLPDMIDSLSISEEKTNGLLMFRMPTSISAIIVHEKVKKSIKKNKIPYMYFHKPQEWAG